MCPDEVGADGASGKVFITMCKTKRQGHTIIHIHSLRFHSFGGFCEWFLKQNKRTLEIKKEISEKCRDIPLERPTLHRKLSLGDKPSRHVRPHNYGYCHLKKRPHGPHLGYNRQRRPQNLCILWIVTDVSSKNRQDSKNNNDNIYCLTDALGLLGFSGRKLAALTAAKKRKEIK